MPSPLTHAAFLCLVALGSTDVLLPIAKSGSAYDGLTVALHDSIPEDSKYLEAVKKIIEKTSEFLYNATDGAAYFRKVNIVIPKSWNNTDNVTEVYEHLYSTSHIRVNPPRPHSSGIEAPFTMQPGGCGDPGLYIELNTDFLTADDSLIRELYGPKEKMMVHEWAHFRFGVHDEYGIPGHDQFPLFFFNDGFLEVAACSNDIQGYMWSDSNGEYCDVYEDKVSSDCFFIPDESAQSVEASIMSIPKLPQVNHFCNSTEGMRAHNWRAPTKQNILCQGRSTWEVISTHPDLAKMGERTEKLPTKFQTLRIKEQEDRYILVLDRSSSMANRPLETLKQACSFYIKNYIPDDSYLGILSFGSSASVLYRPVTINNDTRHKLSAEVQKLRVDGWTSIGAGLQLAIKMLKGADLSTNGATILLLTDGEENTYPYIRDVMQSLKEAKLKVHTVALGKDASKLLEGLATDTGGKSFSFPDLTGASIGKLNQIMLSTITVQGDVTVDRLELMSNQYILKDDEARVVSVIIEKELGKNAFFSVTSKSIRSLEIALVSPTRVQYDKNSTEYEEDLKESVTALFRLPLAEAGAWSLSLKRIDSSEVTVDVSVLSEPRDTSVQPIRVKSWIKATVVSYPEVPSIFAQVTKGGAAVIRAKVVAVIVTDKSQSKLYLEDNGKGADIVADDGIYSAYFTEFQFGVTRYGVVAQVESAGEALVKQTPRRTMAYAAPPAEPNKENGARKGKPANKFPLDRFRKVDIDPEIGKPSGDPVENFTRTTNAGAFQITGFRPSLDLIKPCPVRDLIVLETQTITYDGSDRRTVTLQWTMPGDNMDKGKAEELELRGGNTTLSRDVFFIHGHRFLNNNETVLSGSLDPLEGGTIQNATLLLPLELELSSIGPFDVLFTLRGIDKARNKGDMGNVASAQFGYVIKDKTDVTVTTVANPEDESGGLTIGEIVGIVAAVVAVLLIIIGLGCYLKSQHNK